MNDDLKLVDLGALHYALGNEDPPDKPSDEQEDEYSRTVWTREFKLLPPEKQDYFHKTCPPRWSPILWFELHYKWEKASPEKRTQDMVRMRDVAQKWFPNYAARTRLES